MKKLIHFFLLILFLFVPLIKIQSQSLLVWKKDGNFIRILFDDRPCTMFTEDTLHIETMTNSIDIPLEQVQRYTFELDANDISIPSEGKKGPSFRQKDDELLLSGLSYGMRIAIYTIDGRLLVKQSADKKGEATISLKQLSKGVYLFKIGSLMTYKFTNK